MPIFLKTYLSAQCGLRVMPFIHTLRNGGSIEFSIVLVLNVFVEDAIRVVVVVANIIQLPAWEIHAF